MVADNEDQQNETVNEYAYLGHKFKIEKEKQPAQINRRIRMLGQL